MSGKPEIIKEIIAEYSSPSASNTDSDDDNPKSKESVQKRDQESHQQENGDGEGSKTKSKRKHRSRKIDSRSTLASASSHETLSEKGSVIGKTGKKLRKRRPQVNNLMLDPNGAIERKLEQKYMELEDLLNRQFVERKTNLTHQHIGQMEILRQQYNLSCHGLPPSGAHPYSKPLRRRPQSAHVPGTGDTDETYSAIRTLQQVTKYRKPRSKTRSQSAKPSRQVSEDTESQRQKVIDINLETASLSSARSNQGDERPELKKRSTRSASAGSRQRSRSKSPTSPTTSPSRGYIPTNHNLKDTTNDRIKQWLHKKNIEMRKLRAKERAEKKEKRKESILRENEKLMERQAGRSKVEEWMNRKRREAFQKAREEKERQKLQEEELKKKEAKRLEYIQGKKWLRPASAPVYKSKSSSQTESSMEDPSASNDSDKIPAVIPVPHPPSSKLMYKRSSAGKVRLRAKSNERHEGTEHTVKKSQDSDQLSYSEWLAKKRKEDEEKKKAEAQAKAKAADEANEDNLLPTLSRKKINSTLKSKKKVDTGLSNDLDPTSSVESSVDHLLSVNGSKAPLSSRSGYVRPSSALSTPAPQVCKSPKRPKSAHPRVDAILDEDDNDTSVEENPFRLPFPATLGVPQHVAKTQSKLFPERVAEERKSLESVRLSPQGCDSGSNEPQTSAHPEDTSENLEKQGNQTDDSPPVGALFFADDDSETENNKVQTEGSDALATQSTLKEQTHQYEAEKSQKESRVVQDIAEVKSVQVSNFEQINVTELPLEQIPTITTEVSQMPPERENNQFSSRNSTGAVINPSGDQNSSNIYEELFYDSEDFEDEFEPHVIKSDQSISEQVIDKFQDKQIDEVAEGQKKIESSFISISEQANLRESQVEVSEIFKNGGVKDEIEQNEDIQQTDDIPERLTDLPEQVTDIPEQVTDIPEQVTDIPEQVTDLPEQETDIPEQVTDMPEQVTDIPEQVTDIPEQVTDIPEQVIDIPEQVTDIPEQVTDIPEQVTDIPEQVTDIPVQVTGSQKELTNLQEQVIDIPEQITDIPEPVTDLPEQVTDTPEQVTDIPHQVMDIPEQEADRITGKPIHVANIPEKVTEQVADTTGQASNMFIPGDYKGCLDHGQEQDSLHYDRPFSPEILEDSDVSSTNSLSKLENNIPIQSYMKIIQIQGSNPDIAPKLIFQKIPADSSKPEQETNIPEQVSGTFKVSGVIGHTDQAVDIPEQAIGIPEQVTDQVTDIPEQVTNIPEQVIDIPDQITERKEQLTNDQQQVTDLPEQVTDIPEQVTDKPEQVTDLPEQVTVIPEQVTEQVTDIPEQVIDIPEQITERKEQLTNEQQQVTDLPEQITDIPEQVIDKPEQVTDILKQVTDITEQVTDQATDITEQVTDQATDLPEQETDIPEQETYIPEQETEIREQERDIPEQETDILEQVTDIPEQVTDIPEQVTDIPEQVTDIPEQETNIPEQVRDIPEQVTDIQEQVTDIPEQETDLTEQETDLLKQITDLPEESREQVTNIPEEQTDTLEKVNFISEQKNLTSTSNQETVSSTLEPVDSTFSDAFIHEEHTDPSLLDQGQIKEEHAYGDNILDSNSIFPASKKTGAGGAIFDPFMQEQNSNLVPGEIFDDFSQSQVTYATTTQATIESLSDQSLNTNGDVQMPVITCGAIESEQIIGFPENDTSSSDTSSSSQADSVNDTENVGDNNKGLNQEVNDSDDLDDLRLRLRRLRSNEDIQDTFAMNGQDRIDDQFDDDLKKRRGIVHKDDFQTAEHMDHQIIEDVNKHRVNTHKEQNLRLLDHLLSSGDNLMDQITKSNIDEMTTVDESQDDSTSSEDDLNNNKKQMGQEDQVIEVLRDLRVSLPESSQKAEVTVNKTDNSTINNVKNEFNLYPNEDEKTLKSILVQSNNISQENDEDDEDIKPKRVSFSKPISIQQGHVPESDSEYYSSDGADDVLRTML